MLLVPFFNGPGVNVCSGNASPNCTESHRKTERLTPPGRREDKCEKVRTALSSGSGHEPRVTRAHLDVRLSTAVHVVPALPLPPACRPLRLACHWTTTRQVITTLSPPPCLSLDNNTSLDHHIMASALPASGQQHVTRSPHYYLCPACHWTTTRHVITTISLRLVCHWITTRHVITTLSPLPCLPLDNTLSHLPYVSLDNSTSRDFHTPASALLVFG